MLVLRRKAPDNCLCQLLYKIPVSLNYSSTILNCLGFLGGVEGPCSSPFKVLLGTFDLGIIVPHPASCCNPLRSWEDCQYAHPTCLSNNLVQSPHSVFVNWRWELQGHWCCRVQAFLLVPLSTPLSISLTPIKDLDDMGFQLDLMVNRRKPFALWQSITSRYLPSL